MVEFYVSAEDPEAQVRTWPAPALAASDQPGPSTQTVNALYQVDDTVYSNSEALYKMIFTEQERAILAGIPPSGSRNSNAQMNGTFVTLDGDDLTVHYLMGVRNRTIESAPTSPRDKANDDLMMLMINIVVKRMKGNTCENSSRLDKVEPNTLKCQLKIIDRPTPTTRLRIRESIDSGVPA